MSTQVGNVLHNYGKKHYTTITNLNGETILNKTMSPHTIVVSAPTTISKNDIGTYSLFVTDHTGAPARLTYTIQPGNGLIIGRDNTQYNGEQGESDNADIISFAIDHNSLTTYEDTSKTPGVLYVNKQNIIDNKTLQVVIPSNSTDRIKVITSELDHATTVSYGIAKGDESTILTNNGILSVCTQNLQPVDDDELTDGIVRHNTLDTRTIDANQGILNVITKNLEPASYFSLGVVKPDNAYTFVDANGVLTIENFRFAYNYISYETIIDYYDNSYASYLVGKPKVKLDAEGLPIYKRDIKTNLKIPVVNRYGTQLRDKKGDLVWLKEYESHTSYVNNYTHGIIAPDAITTFVDKEGILKVLTDGLTHAKEADNAKGDDKTILIGGNYGIVKPDGLSVGITNNGLLEVKNYGLINRVATQYDKDYTDILRRLTELEAKVIDLQNAATAETIILDIDNMMYTLDEPIFDTNTGVVTSESKKVTVQMRITTNCKFYANYEISDNLAPAITLDNVEYNGKKVIDSNIDLYTFESTNGAIEQINFTFTCDNFNNTSSIIKTNPSIITIKLTSINDESVYKKVLYTVVRHNINSYIKPVIIDEPISIEQPNLNEPKLAGVSKFKWYDGYVDAIKQSDVNDITQDIEPGERSSHATRFILQGKYANAFDEIVTVDNNNITPTLFTEDTTLGTFNNFPVGTLKKSSPLYIGYIKTHIDYSYTYLTVKNNTLVTDTAKNVTGENANWAKLCLESSYNKSNTKIQSNLIRISSTKNMPNNIESRTATVTLTAYVGEPGLYNETKNTYSYILTKTLNYTENCNYKQTELNVIANLSDSERDSYINLVVSRPEGGESPLKPTKHIFNIWGCTVYMKYVNKNGEYVDNLGNVNNDYTLCSEVVGPITDYVLVKDKQYAETLYPVDTGKDYILTGGNEVTIDIFKTRPTSQLITGIKIVDVVTNSFRKTPKITKYTRGTWNIGAKAKNKNYSFGDAKLTNVKVYPWNEKEMRIELQLVPGATTTIPAGSTIKEVPASANGETTFQVKTLAATRYVKECYQTYDFYATPWNSITGSVITFTFSGNKAGLAGEGIKWMKLFVQFTADIANMAPVVDFAVTQGGLTSQIGNTYRTKYHGWSESVDIQNALYKPVSTSSVFVQEVATVNKQLTEVQQTLSNLTNELIAYNSTISNSVLNTLQRISYGG